MIDLAEGRAVWSGGISLERRLPLNLDVMVMGMGMFMMWWGGRRRELVTSVTHQFPIWREEIGNRPRRAAVLR